VTRATRIALEVLIVAAGLGALLAVGRGLSALFPAFGAVLRALLHPVVLLGVLGALLLLRASRRRPSP
jgi:hypothetical protein